MIYLKFISASELFYIEEKYIYRYISIEFLYALSLVRKLTRVRAIAFSYPRKRER